MFDDFSNKERWDYRKCNHSTNAIQIANARTIFYSLYNDYTVQLLYSMSFHYYRIPTDMRSNCDSAPSAALL